MNEDLRKWFREKWVNLAKKKKGGGYQPCGTSGEKEGYAKCVPTAKAASMSKDEIKSAIRRKRAAQKAAGRPGKNQPGQGNTPIMVKTMKEENIQEKNTPTNVKLWSRAKSLAKSKFDVYPSAYANGWAAKWYRKKGGGWKSTNESIDAGEEQVLQELSIKKKIQAKIAASNQLGDTSWHVPRVNPKTGEQRGTEMRMQRRWDKIFRREKYAEKQKAEKMTSANAAANSLSQKMKEELGHDNEWGRPQLTKKMLKVTPGQKHPLSTFKEYHVPELEMNTVQYHDVLNPAVWDGFEIKPDIATSLMKIAHAFIESWKLDIPVKDVILTGSNANYNWTEFSDFDLHVVVDIQNIPLMYQPFVISLLKSKKELFNSQHKIQIKGYNVEVYAQDVNDTLYATGIYSLLEKRWVKEPMFLRPEFEHSAIQTRANEILQDIDDAIDMKDKERLLGLLDQISQTRKSALTTGGELNTDNLVFKVLRNSGAIQKIRDVLNTLYDQELTLESDAWQRKEGKNPKGGLNIKGIKSYRKSHPGSHLSLAVTTKPSKLKAGSKSAKRRKSFCARMQGMKKRLTSKKTANDPNSRINKSLRKWNCH